ncbi:unnamed protein product [Prunus armeniaca]
MRAVIPPSPQQVCAICSDPTYPMELFPSTMQGFEQVLQVNLFQRPHNDPYSNTYNSGWRNHPNFHGATSNNKLALLVLFITKGSLQVSLRNQRRKT